MGQVIRVLSCCSSFLKKSVSCKFAAVLVVIYPPQGSIHRVDLVIYLPECNQLLERIVFRLHLPQQPPAGSDDNEVAEFALRNFLATASVAESLRKPLPESK